MQKKSPGAPRKAKTAKTISLRLHPDQLNQLDAAASQAGTTRTALIQLAIARFLKKGI